MKKLLFVLLMLVSAVAEAKGGFSGSGGGRGGFSGGGFSGGGGGRSFSAPSRSFSAPAPAPSKGGFSSAPTPPARPSVAPRTTTTTTTTTTRSSSYSYGGRYVSPGPMYGGWGMGYGYSNGLLTGMIIGNMMHPHNTIMYTGPGTYSNNALLYPDGRVVNQQGYVVGTYTNGVFTPVQNGAMAAQPVPADAGQQVTQAPQTIVVEKPGPSGFEIFLYVILTTVIVVLIVILFGVLL